jgi:hypothetical protein
MLPQTGQDSIDVDENDEKYDEGENKNKKHKNKEDKDKDQKIDGFDEPNENEYSDSGASINEVEASPVS